MACTEPNINVPVIAHDKKPAEGPLSSHGRGESGGKEGAKGSDVAERREPGYGRQSARRLVWRPDMVTDVAGSARRYETPAKYP